MAMTFVAKLLFIISQTRISVVKVWSSIAQHASPVHASFPWHSRQGVSRTTLLMSPSSLIEFAVETLGGWFWNVSIRYCKIKIIPPCQCLNCKLIWDRSCTFQSTRYFFVVRRKVEKWDSSSCSSRLLDFFFSIFCFVFVICNVMKTSPATLWYVKRWTRRANVPPRILLESWPGFEVKMKQRTFMRACE